MVSPPHRLGEGAVSNAFHIYLKHSLTQANVDRLLDPELLTSAEADLMITGPALCLFFAALRSTTSPPSVPLPRSALWDTDKHGPPIDLTTENCPRPFIGFLHTWALAVPHIQALDPVLQHDLARIICGLPAHSASLPPAVPRIAAELRAVAIEISQRRSFQDRYADDLQAALDAAADGEGDDSSNANANANANARRVASFQPPPMYEPSPSPSSTTSSSRSPASFNHPLPPVPALGDPPDPSLLSPTSTTFSASSSRHHPPHSRTPSPSASGSRSGRSSDTGSAPASPAFTADAPALQLIRETLYASLADTLASSRSLKRLLHSDPPKAYFAAVALAILDVSLTRTRTYPSAATPLAGQGGAGAGGGGEETEVRGVLGATLTLAMCPRPLQPFMRELGAIGTAARDAEEEDTTAALEALATDPGARLPTPRMERVRRMLEYGIGGMSRRRRRRGEERGVSMTDSDFEDSDFDSDNGSEDEDEGGGGSGGGSGRRRSVEGRAIALANRINALALGMTKLRPFRERQEEVFRILASVSS